MVQNAFETNNGVGKDIALLGEFLTKYHYTTKNALVELWRGYHTNFIKGYKPLYYYMRNFCNLIGLEQWYFSLI